MSKGLWILPVLAAVLIVAGSGTGVAMPSLGGPSGIVTVPNALVAPVGELQVAGTYQRVRGTLAESLVGTMDLYSPDESSHAWALQALAGVTSGAELWAAYSKDNSELEAKTWGIGGKFQIPLQGQTGWNLAVGASYQKLTGDGQFLDVLAMYGATDVEVKATTAYLVATTDLTAMGQSDWANGGKLLGTLGLLYKKADATITNAGPGGFIGVGEGDETLVKPFVGVEFLGQDRTGLGLEYRWKDSDLDCKAVFSAVVKHEFEEGFAAELGTTNADSLGLGGDKQNWFVRVGYTFPMSK